MVEKERISKERVDEMMCLKPQHCKSYGNGKFITNHTEIHTDIPVIRQTLKQNSKKNHEGQECFRDIYFILDIPQQVREKVCSEFTLEYVENEEGYIIDIREDIRIYSPSERGLFYGCLTLVKLMEQQSVEQLLIYDYPVCADRGVKVYLPGYDHIPYFKEFVDMICYYKYNTIMIEIGGAMEYKKHPEINEGWVEYCREMSEYSGKTIDIQENTFKWHKNSIHVENGEGSFLSQDTVKELIRYCEERKLNVIPEIPSLSHCDYLLLNHAEIRERQEDPYPDTYCPSNPASYELLFDILDEIVDVFQPKVMNIGHDEYYSIGLCDKCRGKKAEELYAGDIIKIHDYLARYHVKTMIWGEKLIDARSHEGKPIGGAEKKMYKNYDENSEYWGIVPATHKAIDLVPDDLKILHWYWSFDEKYDMEYLSRGMEVTYSNFAGSAFKGWKKRISRGVRGGIISNWSTLKEENLQRNGMLFELVYSAYMFWNNDYDESMFHTVRDIALKELYHYKYRDILDDCCGDNPNGLNYIQVLHTTDRRIEYQQFYDGIFIEADVYKIGDYVLLFEDGSEARLPIIYGMNISNQDVSWEGRDELMIEAAYTTYPVKVNDKTYYQCIYTNPYPDKKIKGILVEKGQGQDCSIIARQISFL
jgi:hexosaminidase